MIRAMFTAARRVLRRPAFWFLVWSYRDLIALWARSLAAEARRPGRFDPDRFKALVGGLWSTTMASRFVVPTRLHDLRVADDLVEVADEHLVVGFESVTEESHEPLGTLRT